MASETEADQTAAAAAAHAAENKAFFNARAATYDAEEWQRDLTARMGAEMQRLAAGLLSGLHPSSPPSHESERGQRSKGLRLLDYACGTGAVTKALAPFLAAAVGVDIADAMVAVYSALSLLNEQGEAVAVQGVVADLLTPSPSPPPALSGEDGGIQSDFDIAAVGLGFHHFHDPAGALQVLKARVKDGGAVLIIDFTDEGPLPQDAKGTVSTHGFSEARMREAFEKAGLRRVQWSVMDGFVRVGGPKKDHGHHHPYQHGDGGKDGEGEKHGHGHQDGHGHAHGSGAAGLMRKMFFAWGYKD